MEKYLDIEDLKKNSDKYKNVKYIVKIIQWNEDDEQPIGKLINVNTYFENYYPKKYIDNGIKNETLFKGKVQILEDKTCFVILDKNSEKINIEDIRKRNRAMDGDDVVVEITDNSSNIRKGKIVYLNFDKCVYKNIEIKGTIKFNKKSNFVEFYPVSNLIIKLILFYINTLLLILFITIIFINFIIYIKNNKIISIIILFNKFINKN